MAEKQTAKRNRREEILQSLALMLESSDGSQRITTAKLAASVGVSEAAYREAIAYARDRKQFGQAIIEFPAVFEMISLMKAKLDASRSLLYETTRFVDMYKRACFKHTKTLPKNARSNPKNVPK